jgi:hypothetical protein
MEPKWWWRLGIAVVLVAFILLIARTSFLRMRPDTARIDAAVSGAPAPTPPAQQPP